MSTKKPEKADEPKTYRSYGGGVVSDNLVVSFNLRFLLNVFIGLGIFGWTVFTYEQRLRKLERGILEHNTTITELVERHIVEEELKLESIQQDYAKMEEELKWYQQELNLNPLSWKRKKKK